MSTATRACARGLGALTLEVLAWSNALSAACRQSPAHPLAAPVELAFELVNNLVLLPVSVEGSRPLWFVLDTGATSVLTLNTPFVTRERLLASAGTTVPAVVGHGAGGRSEGVVGRVAELELGPFRVEDPVAIFSTESAGAHASDEAQGYLGGGLLGRFRVFLDYQRARILLEPGPALAEPFEYDMSGLRVLTEGADFRTFRVVEVTAESAAAQAGLRAGDVLAAVDGRPAAELTMSELRMRFRREGPCALSIVRGAERLELVLALRRRI